MQEKDKHWQPVDRYH